eukprot:11087-Rhodomonas_salina.1
MAQEGRSRAIHTSLRVVRSWVSSSATSSSSSRATWYHSTPLAQYQHPPRSVPAAQAQYHAAHSTTA